MLRPIYFLLLLTLGATQLPACAQSSDTTVAVVLPAGKLPWLQLQLDSSAILRQHQVGISLADAATGETLFSYNDARYFTPASMMKLFSFYAGLHLLPDSLPSLRYFSRGDTLFFQGTGDPTFLHGDVPSRRAYTFLQSRPEKMLAYCDIATVPTYGPRPGLGRFHVLFPARAHGVSYLWQHGALLCRRPAAPQAHRRVCRAGARPGPAPAGTGAAALLCPAH
ncbi:D-alanyl-D-alanine carboxypeptidase [Hymenobacter humi]|uniref:D-alanyl-D-alanine carboxypeptidase n=1 Tax=Hymenobacter humi TaxID=1411620 RepID=A0ABW2U6T4_9BACT